MIMKIAKLHSNVLTKEGIAYLNLLGYIIKAISDNGGRELSTTNADTDPNIAY